MTREDGTALETIPGGGRIGRRGLLAVLLATTLVVAGVAVSLGGDPREGWFREVGEASGIDYETTDEASDMVGGAFVSDYDRDGDPDVLLTGGDAPALYHNDRGEFERVDALPAVDATVKSALWVDYDQDGWEDLLLVPRIGEPVVLANDRGSFRRVDVGLNVTLDVGVGATAADYDGDGCPDLFVYQAGDWRERVPARGTGNDVTAIGADNGEPNYLFRGDCSSFERVTDAGIEGARWSLAASFADLTGDGLPDVHVANDFNRDVVYRNLGNGSFERVELPDSNRHGMGSAAADVAGDDALDVFVTNIEYADPETVRDVQGGLGVTNRGNNLFVHGDGRFADRATSLGIRQGGWGWSGTFADLDGDGDRDLVHATKDYLRRKDVGLTPVHTRPAFYERTDDGFVRRDAERLGFEPSSGRGLAVLDFDRDGDRDVLVADIDGRFKLYENTRGDGDSLLVDVEPGPTTTALGAVVHVTTTDGKTYDRTVTARSNFLSQNPRTVHVGLDGAGVKRVRVVWPDGTEVVLDGVDAGSRVEVAHDGGVEDTSVFILSR